MAVTFRKFIKGILLRGEISDASDNLEGSLFHNSSDLRVKAYIEGAVRQIVTNSQSQVLTNKTINFDNNLISNIQTSNLKSGVLNVSTTLASASDTQIPSALAVKGYVDSSISTAQTLTNKTINADNNTITNLETDNLKSGVLNVSGTLASASDTQIPSALAVKTYVDNGLATQNQASEISYSNSTSGLSATDVQGAVDALDNDVDNLITLTGVARDSVNLGSFSGTTIGATSTIKQALQNLELAVESSGGGGSSTSFHTSPEALSVGDAVYVDSVGSVSKADFTSSKKNFYGFVKTLIPASGSNVFSENFESGSFATNGWTVVNGAQTNQFVVGTAVSNTGSYSAYISNDGGTTNSYNNSVASYVWFYKDIAIPSSSNQLSFYLKMNGESIFDCLRVIIDPAASLTPTAGSDISATPSGGINTKYTSTSNVWSQKNIGLSSYSGTTIRIIFGWGNDNLAGTQPPVAIDNISIDPAPSYEVQYAGIFNSASFSLLTNTIYNLSSTAGSITTSSATTGNFTVPVGMAISSTSILINEAAAAGVTAVVASSGSSYLSTVSIINSTPYTVLTADLGKLLAVNTATGAKTINLPTSPTTGFSIVIKDYKGSAAANNITVTKSASHTIEQLNSSYICEANFGSWTFIYDGANNWIIL